MVNTLAGAGTYNLGCYTHTGTGFFVKNDGRVGIGTASPETNTLLHLYKNAAASTTVELLRLDCGENSHANSKGGKIVFRDINVYDDTATIEAIRSGGSSASVLNFRLRNAAIPCLTLNHNGSTVNIGQDQTAYKLRVKVGTSSADNGIYVTAGTSSSNHALYVEGESSGGEWLAVRGDGEIRLNASNGHTYAAQGIRFGANASANNLDDYEEGTWTPTFVGQGASIGSGTYIKIGRLVTLRAEATGDTNASSSGALYMGGLPFAVDGTTIRIVISMDSVNASASGNNVASPFNGQMFYMHDQYIRATSTGSNPYYQYSLIQSGTKIYITGSFLTPP